MKLPQSRYDFFIQGFSENKEVRVQISYKWQINKDSEPDIFKKLKWMK